MQQLVESFGKVWFSHDGIMFLLQDMGICATERQSLGEGRGAAHGMYCSPSLSPAQSPQSWFSPSKTTTTTTTITTTTTRTTKIWLPCQSVHLQAGTPLFPFVLFFQTRLPSQPGLHLVRPLLVIIMAQGSSKRSRANMPRS